MVVRIGGQPGLHSKVLWKDLKKKKNNVGVPTYETRNDYLQQTSKTQSEQEFEGVWGSKTCKVNSQKVPVISWIAWRIQNKN